MKKAIAISLAFLMLTSHLGLAVGTHYCMGDVIESKIMIGYERLDCGMSDMEKPPCKSQPSEEQQIRKRSCCENDYLSMEVDDEVKPVVEQNTLNIEFVAVFVISYYNLIFTDQQQPQYLDYAPPLVTRDISILHQVFLL